jgi:hypothetical protein
MAAEIGRATPPALRPQGQVFPVWLPLAKKPLSQRTEYKRGAGPRRHSRASVISPAQVQASGKCNISQGLIRTCHQASATGEGKRMFPNYDDYVAEEYRQFFLSSLLMLGFNHISGDCMEFGCCGAVTLSIAYHASQYKGARGRHLWACDSFQGLPSATSKFDDHPLWQSGNFSMSQKDFVAQCTRNGVPETAYTIVPGFFSETLPALKNPNDIALAFIDCDMYSSTVDVLTFLKPRLKHGMILAFDDYYC